MGDNHDLAVADDGTGHVVWLTDTAVGYCRVPAGGAACDAESGTLEFPVGSNPAPQGSAQVFTVAPNKVVVFAACTQCPGGDPSDHVYRFISVNNGETFPVVNAVGDLAPAGQAGYINTGEFGLSVFGDQFQALDDPASSAEVDMSLAGGFGFSPSVVRVPDYTKVVWAANDLGEVHYSVYDDPDSSLDPVQLNTQAFWSIDKTLSSAEPENTETHLSAGGNGVLLSYASFLAGDERIALRKFDPVLDVFGAPVYIEGPNAIDDNGLAFPHHGQDPTGGIHAVWRTLHDGGRLRYTRSADGGATFTTAANLAAGESFGDPIVEASSATVGFAAWRTQGGNIRVVPLDPQAEPTGPGPGGPGGDLPGPPVITDPSIGDRTLTPGQGTTFTFNSNEPGQAVLTFERRYNGKKGKKKGKKVCLKVSKKKFKKLRKKKRCKGWKKIGEIRQAVRQGANSIPFTGRIAGRKLGKGSYRAKLVITDLAGNVSRTETIKFKVVGKKTKRPRRR